MRVQRGVISYSRRYLSLCVCVCLSLCMTAFVSVCLSLCLSVCRVVKWQLVFRKKI